MIFESMIDQSISVYVAIIKRIKFSCQRALLLRRVFAKGAHKLNIRSEGELISNTATMAVKAALAGLALAVVSERRRQYSLGIC